MADHLCKRPNGSFGLGRFVKRLELAATNDSESKMKHALKILQGCPNAVCIYLSVKDVFGNITNHYGDLAYACMTTSAHNLQRLDMDFSLWSDEGVIMSLVSHCPNLEILHLGSSFGQSDDVVVEPSTLSKLVSLSLTSFNEDWADYFDDDRWKLSSIRHLSVFRIKSIPYALPFFEQHGKQLRSFHFDVPSVDIQTLLDECPNLEDIVISLRFVLLRAMGFILFSHATVQRIGLRDAMDVFSGSTEADDLAPVLDEMADWIGVMKKFPKLTCIRLLDVNYRRFRMAMADEEQKEVWGEFIFRLDEMGVTLEDEQGQRLFA